MKTLSFWQRVSRDLSWLGRLLRLMWGGNNFKSFPTEKSLLISFWYDHAYYRQMRPEDNVYRFLDSEKQWLEVKIADPKRKLRARQLEGNLLKALYVERIRVMLVDFLESPFPEHNYRAVMEAIWSAWRTEEGGGVTVGVEARTMEIPDKVNEGDEFIADGHEVGAAGPLEDEEPGVEPLLNAKTYIIAVQLLLELEGREQDFETISRRLNELRNFIREKFGVGKLPGRLEEFKGFSYKSILNGRSSAKKGQLRMPFRQIMEHPEIFGEGVSARAQKMLKESFK